MQPQKWVWWVSTAWGWCRLEASAQGLSGVRLPRAEPMAGEPLDLKGVPEEITQKLLEAGQQVVDYLAGKRRSFDLELDFGELTLFQRRVMEACQAIPWGAVAGYGELAHQVGSPGAARAVGQVMARNPLALVIPCHRVVGVKGRLTGFGGGLELKQRLLDLEGGGGEASRNA